MEESFLLKRKPKLTVFAGPNGSGKSTVTAACILEGEYINADDIKILLHCDDLTAAKEAEARRETALQDKVDFCFETVLSTNRNLLLMQRAKESGYFIRGYYVLTCDPQINVARVKSRVANGGHDVPVDKIISRYHRALELLPQFVALCDVCSVYDNTLSGFDKIYKKHNAESSVYPSLVWSSQDILNLVKSKGAKTNVFS